jgi:hypothetical protein
MVGNLKSASPTMYRLYLAMKERSPADITEDEIAVASGQKALDQATITELIGKLESGNQTIQQAFKKQQEAVAV